MACSHVFPTYHVMIFRSYGQNLSANPSSAFSAPFEACSWRHLWVTWGPKIRLKNLWPFKDGVCVCKLRPPFALSWRTFALSLKVVFLGDNYIYSQWVYKSTNMTTWLGKNWKLMFDTMSYLHPINHHQTSNVMRAGGEVELHQQIDSDRPTVPNVYLTFGI